MARAQQGRRGRAHGTGKKNRLCLEVNFPPAEDNDGENEFLAVPISDQGLGEYGPELLGEAISEFVRIGDALRLLDNDEYKRIPHGELIKEYRALGEWAESIWNGMEVLLISRSERSMEQLLKDARRQVAAQGARARIARGSKGKHAAKEKAFEMWQQWQSGQTKYKSGAAFVSHVVDSLPALENEKTVERWVREWRKANTRASS